MGGCRRGNVPGHRSGRPNALDNPLRHVVMRNTCTHCGVFDDGGGYDDYKQWACQGCRRAEGEGVAARVDSDPKRFAYATILYGSKPSYVCGAMALGQSLVESGSAYDKILIHTADVPMEARKILGEFWHLRQAKYIMSHEDLHNSPYEQARFKEVFTKLHVLNPDVLPYDRVVFLDLDMVVMRNIDELFQVRPPAAMANLKTADGRARCVPSHGDRMQEQACYFNAGTMVMAPSRALFELLVSDVLEADPVWHRGAWSPEQSYLSNIFAGQLRHISQLFNLEVKVHSGVPLSPLWENAAVSEVAVAHFSGSPKVWDCPPGNFLRALGSKWIKKATSKWPQHVQTAVSLRCEVLQSSWHRFFASALLRCQESGLSATEVGRWSWVIQSGNLKLFSETPLDQPPMERSMVGRLARLTRGDGSKALVTVLLGGSCDGKQPVVWSCPEPCFGKAFCAGDFGLCYTLDDNDKLQLADGCDDDGVAGIWQLGTEVDAHDGDDFRTGRIMACRNESVLVQFPANHSPAWFMVDEIEQSQ